MARGAIATVWRLPLVAAAIVSLSWGAWLGLIRIGWNIALPWPDQLIGHGPLMVSGFLGTLIAVERAVSLGRAWGWAAPGATALGALIIVLTPSGWSFPGSLLIAVGSAVMVAIFVVLLRRQPAWHLAVMALGAVAWTVGNTQWLEGAAVYRVVFWWMVFLVLTIAGERLELNRVLRPSRAVRFAFASGAAALLLGASAVTVAPTSGVRMIGVGLLALAWWLASNDVARRTIRQQGLTRYIASGLLAGYVWLAVGGILALLTGVALPGLVYDATLHAIFLGFVVSMVFAHAPVIFPAVLRRPLVYAPRFYAHLVVLHASVLLRVVGDLVDALVRWRFWGGMLNAVALGVFLLNIGWSLAGVSAARGRAAGAGVPPPGA